MTDLAFHDQPIRQTVILAAGTGTRLGGADQGLPKPLVRVAGRPLIDHALDQACQAGCDEAVIVVGGNANAIDAHVADLRLPIRVVTVVNEDYAKPNGVSLLKAEPQVTGPFFLQMADHVFEFPVLPMLAAPRTDTGGRMRLLVDHAPVDIDEDDATKVCINGTRITAIGKELRTWDAFDAGYFLLDPRVFDALRDAEREEALSVSAGMRQLIRNDLLAPVALNGVRWMDVDTPRDWGYADDLLGRSLSREA